MIGDTGSTVESTVDGDVQTPAGELARVNRTLRLLSSSNQALIHESDESALLKEICRIIVVEGGYRMAVVSFAQHDAACILDENLR